MITKKQETFKRIMANHVIAADALTKADMNPVDFADAIDHLTDNTLFLIENCCGERFIQKSTKILEKYISL